LQQRIVGNLRMRAGIVDGLDGAFDEVERHEVVAMDPAPEAPAHLSVWRRRP